MKFDLKSNGKNTPKSIVESLEVNDGFYLVKVENQGDEPFSLVREVNKSLIQFYFAVDGGATFLFNNGNYKLSLNTEKNLLFYNPLEALPLEIEVNPQSRLVFLYITVENLHQLFVEGSEEIAFLNKENVNQKYYLDTPLSPALIMAINQFFKNDFKGPAKSVFDKSKAYEVLALFFNVEEGIDIEQCPFLKDEENVQKIKIAKGILLQRMAHPPTLKELSREINLNEYRLKEGFKNIYGKTVFQYLNDYRLDTAKHLLDEGNIKVNDAAYHIGYTNPSHFIAAFKKKFGVTPKKYLSRKLTVNG